MLDENTTKSLIKKMFEKQDELNIHTNNALWTTDENLKWYRAIWTEAAELIDYTDWKWWKKQDIQLEDIKMELIDIWHFALSDMMTITTIDNATDNVYMSFRKNFEKPEKIEPDKIQKATEFLAYHTLRDQRFSLEMFVKLCSTVDMTIETIYKLYMGKNILNRFRQDNGYKQKTYVKFWNGQEDNVYLMKFLETSSMGDTFEETIYNKLAITYKAIQVSGGLSNIS